MFSSVIRLGDLDYIAPSQACIKPILDQQKEDAARKRFLLEGGGGGGTVHIRGKGDEMPPPAPRPIKITLADCLACNGCVTTAEEILIEQQQPSEVMATVARIKELKDGTPTIASINQNFSNWVHREHGPQDSRVWTRSLGGASVTG